jgi:nicotinate-nucleotide pyrophosphorylase (carboxylating)
MFRIYIGTIKQTMIPAGDITCLATIPPEVQAEAQFLAKDTGIIAGIAMASLVFQEVDPSLTVMYHVQAVMFL